MHGTCQGYCVCAKFAAKMRTNSTVPRSFNSQKTSWNFTLFGFVGCDQQFGKEGWGLWATLLLTSQWEVTHTNTHRQTHRAPQLLQFRCYSGLLLFTDTCSITTLHFKKVSKYVSRFSVITLKTSNVLTTKHFQVTSKLVMPNSWVTRILNCYNHLLMRYCKYSRLRTATVLLLKTFHSTKIPNTAPGRPMSHTLQ